MEHNMEQLNSETVAIATDKLASTNIQVSSHVQRNGRRKLEDRFVVENDLNSAFDLDVSEKFASDSSNKIAFDLFVLTTAIRRHRLFLLVSPIETGFLDHR